MTSPEIPVKVDIVQPIQNVTVLKASDGQKLPWYKAAARRRQDRDYVPRMDITGSWV